MLALLNVRDVRYSGGEMLEIWDVGMWVVRNVRCLGCGMFGMWDI